MEWFAQRGVLKLKKPKGGPMAACCPTTDELGTIVGCLMGAARQEPGVTIKTAIAPLPGVEELDDTFQLQLRGQAGYAPCDRLSLAAGSSPRRPGDRRSLGH